MSRRAGIGAAAAWGAALAAAASPWLPAAAGAVLLAAAAAVWLLAAAPSRVRLSVGGLLALGAVLLAVEAGVARRGQQSERVHERIRHGFAGLWDGLERAAEVAAGTLEGHDDEASRLPVFRRLAELAERSPAGIAYLVLDPDGVAVAWAGEGLLHDLDASDVPREGRHVHGSYHAVSLAVVRALDPEPRPWRLVVGRSLPTHELPFALPGGEARRWSLLPAGEAPPAGVAVVPAGDWQVTLAAPEAPPAPDRARTLGARGAALLAALALLAAALWGATGFEVRLLGEPGFGAGPAAVVAASLLAAAAGVGWEAVVGLVLAAALAAVAAWPRAGGRLRGGVGIAGAGLAAAALPLAAAWVAQSRHGPVATGEDLVSAGPAAVLRLALLLVAAAPLVALWRAARSRPPEGPVGEIWAWGAAGALLAAGAAIDRPAAAGALLVLGTGAAAMWAARGARAGAATRLGILVLLAALGASAAGEMALRLRLRGWLERELLAATAPPAESERRRAARELSAFFEGADVGRVGLRRPQSLDLQDLGFELWKSSPLARRGALSVLVVERQGRVVSRFSFGLTLTEAGTLDAVVGAGRAAPPELLEPGLVTGASALASGGRRWGTARYWMVLRPGHLLSREPILGLARGLLGEEPRALEPADGVLGPVRFVLYDGSGEPVVSPWPDPPPPAELPRDAPRWIDGPDGAVLALAAPYAAGERALLLPRLSPAAGLERAGTHALAALLPLAAIAALGLLLRLPGVLAAARRALGSYSRRLLLVYAGAVLVPLLLFNFLLVRILGQRLENEQLVAGRAALGSAQSILGEYLSSLEPGFGIDTAIDNELLVWLSRVLRHDVNLYWGSDLYVSSKRELFTSGLLPRRIPGEIYSRLALGGARLAARTHRAWGAEYLELYTAVTVPGAPAEQLRLAASMPLLAQQVEVAEQAASLRRKVVLAATALGLLLAALGARLARSFTRPLMEIVDGTQRIAAGADSLGLAPGDRELATLAGAIDRMAARIAESRRQLVREKEVVVRMIDHITSGVVSVDREQRVVLCNRVARDLLGVEVGDRLDEALAAGPGPEALRRFVAEAGPETPRHRAVQLDGDEEGAREWTLVWVPLPGEGEPAALLVVEDVTEVLRGQRLQAWAEMARIIAHEIKNPLTPIRLSAEHMREVRSTDPGAFDPVFERCTRNILEQVAELQQISGEFLAYSRIPRSEPQPGDLAAMVARVVEPYCAAPPPGVELVLSAPDGPIEALFDDKLLSRALRNLIENALRATRGGGRVEVAVSRNAAEARIEVSDDGPGVDPEQLGRIFDPYFSTHDSGTGLGLPIARRIAEEHGGTIRAANRPGGGLAVVLRLPAL